MKKTIEKIIEVLPDTLSCGVEYFKDNFDKSGQEALASASGVSGILIKLFAQNALDSYFDKLTQKKLENFGANIYLKSSFVQVGKSSKLLDEKSIETPESQSIVDLLIDTLKINDDTFTKEDVLTIFTPQYHPIVVFVKEKMQKLLSELNFPNDVIKNFTRDFNENIESTIIETFGSNDYEKHKEEIESFLFEEKESKLLWDMYKLRKIGFKEDESLNYEETFASWKNVSSLLDKEEDDEQEWWVSKEDKDKKNQKIEAELKPIEELIEEYFLDCTARKNCLKNILFAIADFGKGKSVFLKQYASKLAKEYIETKEGYFPIYFNLRNFSNYSSDGPLGVLSSYLLDEYAIRIDDEVFQKKKYIFLVDSLDESGELTKTKIDKVISSIKNIQNIDKEIHRTNRILITSRPFYDGLEGHLVSHEPYIIKNTNGDDVAQFISLYGFKEEQFNNWLYLTLENDSTIYEISPTGFAKEIIDSVKKRKPINIYQKLLDEKTLSRGELRRPIFSYMIYQLIINNVDFLEIGKIGVYLSFINLLTKDAKHIEDKHHKIDQEEELRYRNILHSISALWMYERHHGKQGILKKADICRVIERKKIFDDDKDVLDEYKRKGVTEIQFLSHSYFGEEDNNLHFQHQSFAEILLAEYYLKVFIKYALDEDTNMDEARSRLILGDPTEQTVLFFKELLKLLKETVTDDIDDNILEKRKLLYPLFASMATNKHNTLYSSDIYYTWFRNITLDKKSSTIPIELLKDWAINKDQLEKIIMFSANVLDSKVTLFMAKTETRNSLFDNELTVFTNSKVSDSPTDIDKWLALTVGNILYNEDIDSRSFFNRCLKNPTHLFDMIRNWNYSNDDSSPEWAKEYFRGIQMNQSETINLKTQDLSYLDFSYSELANISASNALLYGVNFTGCSFSKVDLHSSELRNSTFDDINILGSNDLDLGLSRITQYVFVPFQLANCLSNMSDDKDSGFTNFGASKVSLLGAYPNREKVLEDIFNSLRGLLMFGLKENLFDREEIKSWFDYGSDEVKEEYEKLIDGLV